MSPPSLDLNELTNQTTDFHFESLETQLKFYNQNKIELKPGDFLLTRHSNLNAAHVVFHLVCNQGSLNRCECKMHFMNLYIHYHL